MATHISNHVFKRFSVSAQIHPLSNDTWISMTVVSKQDLHIMEHCIMAMRSISVHGSDGERYCPYLVTWDGTDLVKRRYTLAEYLPSPFGVEDGSVMKVHGFTSPHTSQFNEWDRYREVSPLLNHNIQDFFMSDVQVAYMKLARARDSAGTLLASCPDGMTKTFYPEANNNLDCLLVPLEQETEGTEKPYVLQFLEEILNNEMLMHMFQRFQRTHIKRLVDHGLKIELDEDNGCYVYNDTHFVFPIETIKDMMDICQELETNNFLYYNNPMSDDDTCIQCHVLVPKSDRPINLTVTIEITLGMLEGQDEMDVNDDMSVSDVADVSDLGVNAKIIPLCQRIHFGSGPDTCKKNAPLCTGPLAIKRKC